MEKECGLTIFTPAYNRAHTLSILVWTDSERLYLVDY